MTVVDMGIGNYMDQFSHLQAGDLGHHMHKYCILGHVPVVGCKHILAPLIEDSVQRMA